MARDRAGDMGGESRHGAWAALKAIGMPDFDLRSFSRTIDARTATQRARTRRAKRIVVERLKAWRGGERRGAAFFSLLLLFCQRE